MVRVRVGVRVSGPLEGLLRVSGQGQWSVVRVAGLGSVVRVRVRGGGERASGGFIPGTGDSGVETGTWW